MPPAHGGSGPTISWSNRQRTVSTRHLRLPEAAAAVNRALPGILSSRRDGGVIHDLPEVSVVVVSDHRIGLLHDEFLGDPRPTDVITFLHGEIVLSAETACRESAGRGIPVPREVARYAVHGLLHLAGWTDATPHEAAEMRAVQEKILRRAVRGLC